MQTLWHFFAVSSPSLRSLFAPFLPSEPVTDPVAIFLVIIAIMLVAPLLFERLRLPGIVGLILAGVVVGPHGFGFLERDTTIVLLGTVGLLFLMFMAGLETSLDDLKFNARKAVIFGLATFAVPMVLGIIAMSLLGYSFLSAVLVASCFASHTLLALPIASKLGIMRSQSVTVTLGGTLITNVLALLVLAIVVKAHQGNLTLSFWLFLLPSLAVYTFVTLWGIPRLGRWFFRRFGHDEGAEFTFVVAALFVVSYFAKLIEIEPIIGAFLVGIAITQLIPQLSPLMNRIQFIGNTLFVPFFLISVGMLVNPLILFQEPRSLMVSAVMVGVALVAKFLPAWGASKLFGFDFANMMVIFGLSVAQAASTLAAITVAYNIELVDQLTVNGTVAMILVTCIASPWITARWGQGMKDSSPKATPLQSGSMSQASIQYRILVPVANPSTEDNLLQLALILAKSTGGTLLPLHVLSDADAPISAEAKLQQGRLLAAAETIAHAAVTNVEPIGRVDDSIDKGILRTAQERNANLLICGWKGYSTYRDNFFGSVIDNVARRTLVPILITRFTQPISSTRRIFLAIAATETKTASFQQTLLLTRTLATELKATLQILQIVSNPRLANTAHEIPGLSADMPVQQIRGKFVNQVAQILKRDDLLVIMHNAHPERLNVPTLGVEPEAIARQHPELSVIIAYFPRLV
ncbi:MAG: cation:proton antiporter [Drouetiella hepatica Uher 2000/2452]|uniref:Cation:proton antiporter n=1 Tax=Drouetiella hepatica Uher 2000/2452 TaxID=904376 RepID=A0A951QGF4_9CYAN|nr:cation:proton antiporter [Drouetiella hepatica Uher 2000/2452]